VFDRSRKVSVIVAPHGSTKSWNRDVSQLVLVGIGVVVAILPILLISLAVQLVDHGARGRQIAALQSENSELQEQGRRIAELESELAALREFETRIRRWAGIEFSGPAGTPERKDRGQYRWESEERLLSEVPSLSPVQGWVSRGYELDDEHLGIDLVGETGTPVRAAALGVVRFAGWDDTFGNLVILDHGNGYTSHYGHNDSILVESGSLVPRGQTIARLGTTGQSSAPHVHFEVRLEDEPLDPSFLLSPLG
jgi:murein DD-endopeptidase MepM/ murein hydrolase activator NlpD